MLSRKKVMENSYFCFPPAGSERRPPAATMDMPTTSRKHPASSPLNPEAQQPIAHVGSISPPRVLCSNARVQSANARVQSANAEFGLQTPTFTV